MRLMKTNRENKQAIKMKYTKKTPNNKKEKITRKVLKQVCFEKLVLKQVCTSQYYLSKSGPLGPPTKVGSEASSGYILLYSEI